MADKFEARNCSSNNNIACTTRMINKNTGNILDYSNLTVSSNFMSCVPSTSSALVNDVFDVEKTTISCGESPGSVSNSSSSITLQDISLYSSDPMLDFSNLLSPTVTNWTQTFLTNDNQAAENNLHVLFQDDSMSSRSYCVEENSSSLTNQGLLQDDDMIRRTNMGLLPSQQLFHGLLDHKVEGTLYHDHNNYQAQSDHHSATKYSVNQLTQLVKASNSNSKQPLQFSNETAFWNPLCSPRETQLSNIYHSMSKQVIQNDNHSNYTNLSAKSSFGPKVSNLTLDNKIVDEPTPKKTRIATPSSLPTFKVRKEKLGDRITALQQLVSPFGKTDTASVLHEAIDYIKFLHDQVRVLSAPYLKNDHQIQYNQMQRGKITVDKMSDSDVHNSKQDELRSLGLCLVPISSTYPAVSTETPLDFWTPTFGAITGYMYNTQ